MSPDEGAPHESQAPEPGAALRSTVEALRALDKAPPLRWEGKIEHPRQLMSALRAMLEDLGYKTTAALDERTSPMRDVSYFHGMLIGREEQERIRPQWIALGILLVPLLVGFIFLARANQQVRSLLLIEIEGESYLSRAGGEDSQAGVRGQRRAVAERSGVVGDVRISLRQLRGRPEGKSEHGLTALKSPSEALAHDVAELTAALAERWPALMLLAGEAPAVSSTITRTSGA